VFGLSSESTFASAPISHCFLLLFYSRDTEAPIGSFQPSVDYRRQLLEGGAFKVAQVLRAGLPSLPLLLLTPWRVRRTASLLFNVCALVCVSPISLIPCFLSFFLSFFLSLHFRPCLLSRFITHVCCVPFLFFLCYLFPLFLSSQPSCVDYHFLFIVYLTLRTGF